MLTSLQTNEVFKWYNRNRTKRLYRTDKASIIEDYIANNKSIRQLAKEWQTREHVIQAIIELYYKKPDYTITIMSKI